MRMIEVLFVFLVASFASCHGAVAPTKNQLTISTKDSTATAKALQKFFTEDAKKNKNNARDKVKRRPCLDEACYGTTVVSSDTESGEEVTVTVYNNNGLWQRFQRWWNRLLNGSTRRLRHPITGEQ
ncbi:Hypothetical protein PHPALM_7751 [Phytophthora palmivora]|uniref:RxLR effector n=1 Tax=Phytophthora palmivora TaxID=4796 RepID=A0A2P4YBJ2_9STRA|nr:Hypothetical protein PHPALM_7751 [Phytophthora palmivora]